MSEVCTRTLIKHGISKWQTHVEKLAQSSNSFVLHLRSQYVHEYLAELEF